jgi:hypothetical protein
MTWQPYEDVLEGTRYIGKRYEGEYKEGKM